MNEIIYGANPPSCENTSLPEKDWVPAARIKQHSAGSLIDGNILVDHWQAGGLGINMGNVALVANDASQSTWRIAA